MRMPSFARRASVSLIGLTACLAIVGCANASESDDNAEIEAPTNENVQLPPVPELPLLDIPRQYDDGSLSVIGLLIERDEHMLDHVTVAGMVVDIYECDTGDKNVKKGDDGLVEGCLYPHFYIADTPDSTKRILVTGYNASHYEPQLQVMTRYRVSGTYSIQASGFSSSETGLIVADVIEGSGVEPPSVDD